MFKDKDIIHPSDVLLNSFVKNIQKSNNDISYLKACEEIANDILSLDIINSTPNKGEIFKIIKNKSSKYKLSKIPKNVDILKLLPEDNYYKKLLKLKPSKTSSGIAVITVMPMPFECPHGKCIYCPGGIEVNTPLSYIGTEPATKIAQHVNYDPFRQVWSKILQLIERGHSVDKAELVIVGGTFPFYPIQYQKDFVKKCYDAFNLFNIQSMDKDDLKLEFDDNESIINFDFSENLEKAKKNNEISHIRCVGLTIETKPDYCKKEHIDTMLELGTTRIEIGVQSLNDEVFKTVNRGHTLNDVYEAFYLAKNCGYKIAAHMMPGLPKSSLNQDIDDFKKLFDDERLRPDMLKIYPTLVIKNTGLYKLYQENKYNSYSTDDLVKILVEIKKIIPPWTRIMRIQREIETNDIISGPKIGNLRQLVLKELDKQGIKCKCIRCREIGLKDIEKEFSPEEIKLCRMDYFSSDGKEIFLSFESKDSSILFGFLRLRIMSNPQRNELSDEGEIVDSITKKILCGVVRELHVYGPLVKIGFKSTENNIHKDKNKENNNLLKRIGFIYQHKGLGQNLLKEAEKICKQEYNLKKLSVISAIGTREYYKKFGYVINGPYVTKAI
ncbi:MAG: tRNA uridine(34) 5-carboxymethylaminomethyl modification radical SAM/GNAT enzyme Elp3 [Candidatus Nitrosocosmicus sp.]